MKLHYVIENGEYLKAGEASSNVKKVLKQLGIPSEIIRKVAIAMYEAEINMVIHANGGYMDVEILGDRICVSLVDVGPGIPDIELAMKEGYSTASEKARGLGFGAGMGLPNIRKNSDFLKIESEVGKGTIVKIEINLSPDSE